MRSEWVVLDLDDTLTDTRGRHHAVAEHVFREVCGEPFPLSLPAYLARRRGGSSNAELFRELLPGRPEAALRLAAAWRSQVEERRFLELDTLRLRDPAELAGRKREAGVRFALASLRSRPENGRWQLARLGLAPLFDHVRFLPHDARANPKAALLRELAAEHRVRCMVGDAESDREAADAAGVEFAGVATGLYPLRAPRLYTDVNEALRHLLAPAEGVPAGAAGGAANQGKA